MALNDDGERGTNRGKPSANIESLGDGGVAEQPLTFQPAVDDRGRLMSYLKGVCQRYHAHRQQVLSKIAPSEAEGKTCIAPPNAQKETKPAAASEPPARSSVATAGPQLTGPAFSTNPVAAILSSPRPGETQPAAKQREQPVLPSLKAKRKVPSLSSPPLAPTERKRKAKATTSGNGTKKQKKKVPALAPRTNPSVEEVRKAAIRRAKARTLINIHAPDPEQDSPPGETEGERRRRKERINGRRKRAKKLIEIEEMDSQVMDLTTRNEALKAENDAFRQTLAQAKNRLEEGGALTADFLCMVPVATEEEKTEDSKVPAQESKVDPGFGESKLESPPRVPSAAGVVLQHLTASPQNALSPAPARAALRASPLEQQGLASHPLLQQAVLDSCLPLQRTTIPVPSSLGSLGIHLPQPNHQPPPIPQQPTVPQALLVQALAQLSPQQRADLQVQLQPPPQNLFTPPPQQRPHFPPQPPPIQPQVRAQGLLSTLALVQQTLGPGVGELLQILSESLGQEQQRRRPTRDAPEEGRR